MPPDHDLISQTLAGNRLAYADLIRRYERPVHATAWAILRDHHAAQDITQETFLKAYRQLPTLRTTQTFAPWLFSIARNAATDLARSRRRLIPVPNLPETPSLDPAPTGDEDAALLLAAIAQLPNPDQHLLLLRYFNDLPVALIADILSSPVGTITKQLSRALAQLRKLLKETP